MLQVGRFDKTYSPRIIRGGSLAVYETFATVTTFPLMYFHLDHGLPTKYLNLLAKATPSYREGLGNGRSKKQYADWDALQRDVAAYRMLCDGGNRDYSYKTMDRLFQSFKTKRDEILAGEGYETHERSEDDWRYPDTGHSYWNKYSTVFFRNMNANRDGLTDARWFADYYEEQP
jgi:hypothetical protein